MHHNKLPADPSSLTLGIIALCIGVVLGCCGFSIIGVILSIIGLLSANKSLQQFDLNPNMYLLNSKNNVSTAKVINIIALIINGAITLFFVAYFIIYGTVMLSMLSFLKNIDQKETTQEQYNYDEEDVANETDSINNEADSIYNYQDSLNQE